MAIPVGRGLDGVSFRDLGFSFSRREPMDPCFWGDFLEFPCLVDHRRLKMVHPSASDEQSFRRLWFIKSLAASKRMGEPWPGRFFGGLYGFRSGFSCRGPVLARKDGGRRHQDDVGDRRLVRSRDRVFRPDHRFHLRGFAGDRRVGSWESSLQDPIPFRPIFGVREPNGCFVSQRIAGMDGLTTIQTGATES